MGLSFKSFIIYVCLGLISYLVLQQTGILTSRKGTKQSRVSSQAQKDKVFDRKVVFAICNFVEKVEENFGFPTSSQKLQTYDHYISRLNLVPPLLGRALTSVELAGGLKCIRVFLLVIGGVLGIAVSKGWFFLFVLGLVASPVFEIVVTTVISSWDAEIEKDFPRFFELMYSRLLRGAHVRLAPSLDEYARLLDSMYAETEHVPMRRFVSDFRMAIELYGDESIAIRHLRLSYSSATVVNFFNVALQSLRGADSRDKLLSLKLELSRRQVEALEKEGKKRQERGQRMCMLLYIILAQFIVLTWLSKLGVLG